MIQVHLQSDCVALHNALQYEFATPEPVPSAAAIAAIDVGAEHTNIVISASRNIWFRTIAQGGGNVTTLAYDVVT